MNDKKYCVYIHTNKETDRKYIGMTSQKPKSRWLRGNGYMNNEEFYNDILKLGWESGFTHEVIYSKLSKMEARIKEKELIALYEKQGVYNIVCKSRCAVA